MKIPQLALALLLCAPAAFGQARVVQFRSAEDPNSPADPAVCAAAPFAANLRLGGSLYTYEVGEKRGTVDTSESRRIGKATACAQITSFLFPEGISQLFYVQLTLPDGVYTGTGSCTIVSNKVPQAGLVLAGCSLKLIAFPPNVIGGAVVSLSTFNPFRLAGFTTGSYWTVQVYDQATPATDLGDSDRAMEWSTGESE